MNGNMSHSTSITPAMSYLKVLALVGALLLCGLSFIFLFTVLSIVSLPQIPDLDLIILVLVGALPVATYGVRVTMKRTDKMHP